MYEIPHDGIIWTKTINLNKKLINWMDQMMAIKEHTILSKMMDQLLLECTGFSSNMRKIRSKNNGFALSVIDAQVSEC